MSEPGQCRSCDDHYWMGLALAEARQAGEAGEIPIGCVLVDRRGRVLARGQNFKERQGDPTAHAEMVAIRAACRCRAGRAAEAGLAAGAGEEGSGDCSPDPAAGPAWSLTDTTLYVTIEPCLMCIGAMIWARVGRLVYGAADPKAGAAGSLYCVPQDLRLNHRFPVLGGVRAKEARELMQAFFRQRRR